MAVCIKWYYSIHVQVKRSSLLKGIFYFKNGGLVLEAYTNVNYPRSMVDRRLTTRYYIFLGGNLMTWSEKNDRV